MAKSFEDNITRLEEIVSQLERGDAKLADSLKLFEEGTKLVTSCGKIAAKRCRRSPTCFSASEARFFCV